jgi:peptidoglycan/LPS O-acetylase OafA/YrhL
MVGKPLGSSGAQAEPVRTERIPAFDYLRSFGVLLVLLHHAALAYVTFGYLNPEDPTATFSPIVDSAKWAGFDLVVLLNDTFFMPLLFFVSGLFVWQSLERKGAARFLLGRLTRLGIPFLIGVVVLIPVAFYATVLEIELVYGLSQGFGEFWIDFARRGFPHQVRCGSCGSCWPSMAWLRSCTGSGVGPALDRRHDGPPFSTTRCPLPWR